MNRNTGDVAPQYTSIDNLRYCRAEKPPEEDLDIDPCGCELHCNEDCLNRSMCIECFGTADTRGQHNCSIGDSCGNREMGQHQSANCEPQPEPNRGWGLVITQDISKDSFIKEYVDRMSSNPGVCSR